ncbi:MAG: hypothetical protein H0T76_07595 [Nannocystis sp.]|nr:hypothetical protein [Nannocystis sp.]MBA3546328.1 hypothetical protein [Nannocystis sp.]
MDRARGEDRLVALRGAIAGVLGLSALVGGCTDREIAGGGTGSTSASTGQHSSGELTGSSGALVTTGGGVGSSTGADTTSTSTGAVGTSTGAVGTSTGAVGTSTGDASTSGGLMKFDMAGMADLGCEETPNIGEPMMEVDAEMLPACLIDPAGFDCVNLGWLCRPRPEGADNCDACDSLCVDLPVWCYGDVVVRCGPYPEGEQCCYVVESRSVCGDGRPLLVEGVAQVAESRARGDWQSTLPREAAAPGQGERAALVRAWTVDGLAEHASIASFARFVLQLLALGAPAALVTEAQQALADEVEHARLAFALASRHAGVPVGPDALPAAATAGLATDLEGFALALVREGCVGETIAALQVELAYEAASDPAARAALERISGDERRHGLLAWQALRWALDRGDEHLCAAVAQAFAEAEAPRAEPDVPALDLAVLRAHGRLSAAERDDAARRCLDLVIRPNAAALLRGRLAS